MNKKYLLISSCLILIMSGNGEINRVYATTNSPLHGPQSSDKASSSSSSASLPKESGSKPMNPPPPTDSPPPLPTLSSVQEKPLPALPMQGTNSTSRAAPLNSQPSQISNTDKPQVNTPSLSSSNPVVNRVRSNATATLPLSAFPKQEPSSDPRTDSLSSQPSLIAGPEKQTENNQKLETPQVPVASASEGLAIEQIKMLREVLKQTEVCYNMGKEVAKKAAQSPEEFEEYFINNPDKKKDSIFPINYKSIFEMNPKYVSETYDFSKMDEQSFVFHLKEQRKTVGNQVSAILKEILGWEDISKLDKYRLNISSDLRAMSSFCTQPIQMLEKAIELKKTSPTQTNSTSPSQEKKQGFGGKLKNIFTKP